MNYAVNLSRSPICIRRMFRVSAFILALTSISARAQQIAFTWDGRVIPGTSFNEGMNPGGRVPLDELRKDFTTGGFKVMGEIGLQYEGISPTDPSVD